MGLMFCNRLMEADAPLEGLELKSLFDNMKCATWMVLLTLESNDFTERVASGVSVNEHGFIITSSFQLEMARHIQVRGFKNDKFIPAKRVSFVGDKFGLALLKIDQGGCDFAEVVHDPNLIPGRDVYAIAHVMSLYRFTLMTGNLVSPLRKKDQVGIKTEVLDEFFDNELDHKVQLLAICGFGSHLHNVLGMQALGAPVFNSKGQVIGVIVASDSGFDYAVPSSYLLPIQETVRVTMGETGEASTQQIQ